MPQYDIITVGGGLAGSALAKSLAEHGMKVLVLEWETVFKDRLRGEQMHPWGVAELRELGLYRMLLESCGHELPWVDMFLWPQQIAHRDLTISTPQRAPEFSFYHPAMQEVLAKAAVDAGAEVRRGVRVSGVEPGSPPRALLETRDGKTEAVDARMVIGCDGRRSMVRQWGGFEVQHDSPGQLVAGLLFENSTMPPENTSHLVINSQLGREVALFPQGAGRLRAYLIYQASEADRFQGEKDISRFIDESVKTGAPADQESGGGSVSQEADCRELGVAGSEMSAYATSIAIATRTRMDPRTTPILISLKISRSDMTQLLYAARVRQGDGSTVRCPALRGAW